MNPVNLIKPQAQTPLVPVYLCILHGVPGYVCSDNILEFVARAVRAWIEAVGQVKSDHLDVLLHC